MRTISVVTGAMVAFFLLSVGVVAPSQAQPLQQVTVTGSVTATPLSSVVVTLPVIVSELHGTVQVMGTANLPEMTSYYLELRPLNNDSSIPTD